MIRIGYVPGAFDLFHIGHLNILRQAKENCDYLIAGVAADDVLIRHKVVTPVVPLLERLEIVRNVRYVNMAHAAMTNDKIEIWKELRFNVLFKGDDWRGTEKGQQTGTRFRQSRRRRDLFSLHASHLEQRSSAGFAEYRRYRDPKPQRRDARSRRRLISAMGHSAATTTRVAPVVGPLAER